MIAKHNLPHASDLEEAIIGALLIDDKAIIGVAEILKPEMFYFSAHRAIYTAIDLLYRDDNHIDVLTVCNKLRKEGNLEAIGGEYFILQFAQKIFSSAHIESHAYIIIQKYIQRRLIQNSREIINQSYKDEKDVFELLEAAYNELNNVSEVSIKGREVNFSDLIDGQILKGRQIFEGMIKPGLETPISRLTDKTGGWRKSELIILAARPGMGKTAFALLAGLKAAKNNIPTAFFSLEMSKEQLTNRLISTEALIDNQKFTIQGLSKEDEIQIHPIRKTLKTLPFIIDDTASITIEELQIKAKRLKAKHNIGLIIVDYLQLMTSRNSIKGNNREQEISKISRGLKMIAKNLDIPVIALSQLSRAVETRGGSKRPQLSDLRESGAIEQDADMVMFLYRPEYYGILNWDDYNGSPTKDEAEYMIAKNRNGGLTRNRMRFQGRYTLFSDLESYGPNWE